MVEDSEEFGMEEEEKFIGDEESEEFVRVRLPRDTEVIGIVQQRLGGGRMRVACMDGKSRICVVPGRLKKQLWVREEDVLIIKPWLFGGNEKGDVVYKYRRTQVGWLKRKGYLDKLNATNEF